jgi:hypothetical protein
LRGKVTARDFFEQTDDNLSVSVITVAELYSGVNGTKEEEIVEAFLELFEIFPVTNIVAKMGSEIRNKYKTRFGVGPADALIAATSIHHASTLATLNRKHFETLEKVVVPY